MQNTFLNNVAKELLATEGYNPENWCVIFPNKRPDQYFRRALHELNGTENYPASYSIEEFIAVNSSIELADPLELLFILYKIHLKYKPDEEFDKFHQWGNMLLRDYDEIDKNLIDPKRFFANLGAAKEIEATEQDEAIALEFWTTISRKKPTELQEQFLMNWELFEKNYYDLNKFLKTGGKGYSGMLYRKAATKFASGDYNKLKQYVFVGFNALSKAEETIFASLLRDKRAVVYFDADDYYLSNPAEEAGYFIRKAIKNLGLEDIKLVSNRLTTEEKRIIIYNVPMESSQAKALSSSLQEIPESFIGGNSAIIIPDENMLQPLRFALPATIRNINFTAGLPLNSTTLYTLFESIASLQSGFEPAIQSFFYKDVLAVLTHPFLQNFLTAGTKELIEQVEKFTIIQIPRYRIIKSADSALVNILFQIPGSVEHLISNLQKILGYILSANTDDHTVENYFFHLIENLKGFLLKQDFEVNINTFWRFFRQHASQLKLPLNLEGRQLIAEGETVKENIDALQVMGMLETRCLDFENVFILNVNEGTLPGTKHSHSYIPYDIRKAFRLPTYEEQESLSTYYFYRLLQGAKNIHLYYNSAAGSKGAEPSRYIRQIEYFLKMKNPAISIERKNYSIPMRNQQVHAIELTKDEVFFSSLSDKSTNDGISPSFISSFYTCTLQFLFNYVAKLEPPVKITEDIEADRFGTIFHAIMEEIYKDYTDREVTLEILRNTRANIDSLLEKALKDNFWDSIDYKEQNSLRLETIKALVNKAIDEDEKYAPFYIRGMEKKLHFEIEMPSILKNKKISGPFPEASKIRLQGTIDRIDEKDGRIRIVDYKTGNVQKFDFNYDEPETILSKYNKEAFQAIFYCYLYFKNTGRTGLLPTILPLRRVTEGYQAVNEKQGGFSEQELDKFEVKLKKLLSNIFDESMSIKQVDDVNICGVCDYKNICLK